MFRPFPAPTTHRRRNFRRGLAAARGAWRRRCAPAAKTAGYCAAKHPAPVANYVPWVREDNFVYLSGQLPFLDGELLYPGKVPVDVSVDEGRAAARQSGINLISALNSACEGDLNRVRRCLRIDGYVASAPGFAQQSAVVNGVSGLMVEVFGDAGRHSRTAVGANELPLNACVEVAAVFMID
ncbi:MAG: RidA family protein [Pseudohongiellaceae bacterium]